MSDKYTSRREAELRIQHLKFEKARWRAVYRRTCAEINDHIKNCEKWILRLDKEDAKALYEEGEG